MAKKEKSSKPAVLSGTVPEWASTSVIAQLLGKTVRRVQQLTQEGVLETEIPPGGGTRKYRTCETIQRYVPAEQVTEEMTEFLTTFKKFALNIPPRMAGSLSGSADVVAVRAMEKAMRKELEKLLATFTDGASIEREDERL